MRSFALFFAALPDPRAPNARHDLSELLFVAIAAVLCGAESCEDMAEFGAAKLDTLRQVLRLRHGAPSHDTFSRVFRLLDPVAFETVFRRFAETFAAHLSGQVGHAGQQIAIDGKSLAGAFERGAQATPLHLVTAWAVHERLVLAQQRAPGRSEVTAALDVVALLDLHGATVTADALHATRQMAAAIRTQGGEYVLALKGNRGPLHRAAIALLAEAPAGATEQSGKPVHGRIEQRQSAVVAVPGDWPERFGFEGLAAVARIDSTRRVGAAERRQTRYFILSRVLSAEQALATVRGHWGIENQQHWLLDVVLHEDAARNRKDHGPQNIALLRRLALNLLRADTYKASIRRKIKRAGWQEAYLFSLLSQMR